MLFSPNDFFFFEKKKNIYTQHTSIFILVPSYSASVLVSYNYSFSYNYDFLFIHSKVLINVLKKNAAAFLEAPAQ